MSSEGNVFNQKATCDGRALQPVLFGSPLSLSSLTSLVGSGSSLLLRLASSCRSLNELLHSRFLFRPPTDTTGSRKTWARPHIHPPASLSALRPVASVLPEAGSKPGIREQALLGCHIKLCLPMRLFSVRRVTVLLHFIWF